MPSIDERRRLIEAKMREQSEDIGSKAALAFDAPQEEDDEPELSLNKRKPSTEAFRETAPCSIEDYRSKFFVPTRIKHKTAFTVNVETLDILRNVLQDLNERVPMAAYIENILREHLSTHRELLNQATAKQRRKITIPL